MTITVTNEIGRRKNPYCNCKGRYRPAPCCSDCECDHWDKFEQSVRSYPAPNISNGECKAELQWQEQTPHGNWINVNEPDKTGNYTTRQIYVKTNP